ncbi:MAG: hypothetical protein H6837_18245 [Planctomycetes bacterium]|nr:hypothetical protein [Planctomycetota bacterium]
MPQANSALVHRRPLSQRHQDQAKPARTWMLIAVGLVIVAAIGIGITLT